MLDASPTPASSSSLACGANEAQSRPPSDFNILWDEALRRYRTETKRDLLELPIAKAYPSRPSNADEIMNVFDKGDIGSIDRARKLAEEVFGENWDKKGDKIYEEGAKKAQVWGIGHCHIDTAW